MRKWYWGKGKERYRIMTDNDRLIEFVRKYIQMGFRSPYLKRVPTWSDFKYYKGDGEWKEKEEEGDYEDLMAPMPYSLPCLICGEKFEVGLENDGPVICDKCRAAVLIIRKDFCLNEKGD